MSNPNVPEPPISVLILVGPLVLGSLSSTILFGISIIQLYLYFLKFSNDKFIIQFSVYMIFAIDVFLTVATWALAWFWLCLAWGRFSVFSVLAWRLSSIPIGTGILSAWVQIFYAWRVHAMVHWRVIPVVIIIVALAQAGAAVATGIGVARLSPIKSTSAVHAVFPQTIVWLAGAALVDIIIAISMVYILYAAKKRAFTGSHTEKVIKRLIRFTVETGIITALCATLELGFFISSSKTSNVHIAFLLILSKLYSNALMTSLNSRTTGSFAVQEESTGTVTSSYGFAHTNTSDDTSKGIHVLTEVGVSDQPIKKQDYEAQRM